MEPQFSSASTQTRSTWISKEQFVSSALRRADQLALEMAGSLIKGTNSKQGSFTNFAISAGSRRPFDPMILEELYEVAAAQNFAPIDALSIGCGPTFGLTNNVGSEYVGRSLAKSDG